MTPERWQQIRSVYEQVLALDPNQRSGRLETIAAGDPDLLHEVESMLAYEDRADSKFLNVPAAVLLKFEVRDGYNPSRVGRRIGAYRIIEEIGHGGMGEVYRAARADGEYEQQVAIKLVRCGYDTNAILERFRHERQILATLDHPNIARLLDGGTTDEGLPYLVLELIDGLPIDQYCAHHQLALTERLRLFVDVCTAVQYAHQRLLVHRDLKPSNILVTAEGVPKLLDFGIAKILDPAVGTEVTLMHPLTPECASPEQILGQTITTASDVYSLGVVLYRLLTGNSPYRLSTQSTSELAAAVTSQHPERPSVAVLRTGSKTQGLAVELTTKLSRRLAGGLDDIVLKALRKEPEHRYESVERLSADIRREMQGLPVQARKGSWRYRSSKFVGRHRIGMIAAVLVALTVLGGVVATVREARIASANARRAERRFNDVRKLANSLLFEIHDSIKDLPGSTPARKLLVTRALDYLDSLSQEVKGDAALQRELAAAYQRIGDVQGQPRQANLGDPAGAEASYRKALAIREALAASDPRNIEIRRELVPSYGKLSDLLRSMGDLRGAMAYSSKEFETAKDLYQADPGNLAARVLFGTYSMDHGYKQATIGQEHSGGLENMRQGSLVLQQVIADQPDNMYARRILGLSYSRSAEILRSDPAERSQALTLERKSLAINEALLTADPNNADYRRLVAYNQFDIAGLLADMGDLKGALTQDREAIASFETLAAKDPASMQFQEDIAEIHNHIGEILTKTRDFQTAIQELTKSLDILNKLPLSRDPHLQVGQVSLSNEFWLGKAHAALALSTASLAAQREHCHESLFWFRKALPDYTALEANPSGYDGTDRVPEIQRTMQQCMPAELTRR
ncbi:MAG TPA: protein kinase [Candidatus Sulfotelmatobacter sp.]|nr:protein kinase [Candidatus Sulfotelmatobacter sp.]